MTDNSLKRVNAFRDLTHLRVTSLAGFEKCPRHWALRQFSKEPERSSKWAAIGTAIHTLVEGYLRHGEMTDAWWLEWDEWLKGQGVSPDERGRAFEYLAQFDGLVGRHLALETEFVQSMFPDALPIMGHIDCAFKLDDHLLIVDHKTNRSFQDSRWWSQQLQPILYCWAAARLWPTDKIKYRIGYVNLQTYVEWEVDPAANNRTAESRFAKIWDEMVRCDTVGLYPEAINDDCRYCPVRDSCPTLQRGFRSVLESFDAAVQTLPPAGQFDFVRRVRLAAEKIEEQLKQTLLEQYQTAGGKFEDQGWQVDVYQKSQRKVHAAPALFALLESMQAYEDVGSWCSERLEEMITFKVGGVDKFRKEFPKIAEIFDPAITEVKLSPSVDVRKRS